MGVGAQELEDEVLLRADTKAAAQDGAYTPKL